MMGTEHLPPPSIRASDQQVRREQEGKSLSLCGDKDETCKSIHLRFKNNETPTSYASLFHITLNKHKTIDGATQQTSQSRCGVLFIVGEPLTTKHICSLQHFNFAHSPTNACMSYYT